MPEQICCESCDLTLLSFALSEPKPIGRDSCPECGETEFRFVEE